MTFPSCVTNDLIAVESVQTSSFLLEWYSMMIPANRGLSFRNTKAPPPLIPFSIPYLRMLPPISVGIAVAKPDAESVVR